MVYTLAHLLFLLAATLGVWLVRRRVLLVVGGLLLFPLPAAMFNYLAAPVPAVVATISESASGGDCAKESPSETSDRGDVAANCASDSRVQVLLVVLVVNYLTVLLGFATGMLCRRALARREENLQAP